MANVLVVEDDLSVLETTKIILEEAGHVVETAENGAEALTQLAAHRFDLVVTDILMPEMDGVELLQELARSCPEMKVITYSGGGRRLPLSFQKISKVFGAAAFIHKPFTMTELVEQVNDVLSAT